MAGVTDIDILDSLNLKIGDEITLLELDERVEKLINNEDMETPLEAFYVDEIVSWGQYIFYMDGDSETYYTINFETIKSTGDENTIIRIKYK